MSAPVQSDMSDSEDERMTRRAVLRRGRALDGQVRSHFRSYLKSYISSTREELDEDDNIISNAPSSAPRSAPTGFDGDVEQENSSSLDNQQQP